MREFEKCMFLRWLSHSSVRWNEWKGTDEGPVHKAGSDT